MYGVENSYQLLLVADDIAITKSAIQASRAAREQAFLAATTQLARANPQLLKAAEKTSELSEADAREIAVESERLHTQFLAMSEVTRALTEHLPAEMRAIRQLAFNALREGCLPGAFDSTASWREALLLFRHGVEHPLGVRDYAAWFNIGWLVWKIGGDLPEAEQAFATAVRQSLESRDIIHQLAVRHLAYMRMNLVDIEGAARTIALLGPETPADPEAQFIALGITARTGRAEDVIIAFEALAASSPVGLLMCLCDPALDSFQAHLQPVIDVLLTNTQAAVTAAINIANAKMREATDIARLIHRDMLLGDATRARFAAIQQSMAKLRLADADWVTLHRLDNLFSALAPELNDDIERIRPRLPILRLLEWVQIPAGEFLYGTIKSRMHLAAFEIMKYPVTVGQYRLFCAEAERAMPTAPDWGWHDDHPMVNVTWHDAQAFAAWAGLSLPTEYEWEKAARGADGRCFVWGNTWDTTLCRHSVGSGVHATVSVGSLSNGASAYDVQDMAGNVWEWTASLYDPNSQAYVLRGGSWVDTSMDAFRTDTRLRKTPDFWNDHFGFRCVWRPPTA